MAAGKRFYFQKHSRRGVLAGLFLFLLIVTLSILLLFTDFQTDKGAATVGVDQGIPTDIHFRVVWIQDMGDGSDVDAVGSALRLMGMDSGDGQGERVILGKPGNYVKPLITTRGERVVYSDRVQKKVFLVNWDGSELRELADGFGLALWQDPQDGQEWLYYGSEEMMEGGFHCRAVYRKPLDNPEERELIWDKAPVNIDSFQLSTNGLIAGGNIPWPGGGVVKLPNKSMEILTKGCWPALATAGDRSYYWIFDGAHRNLTIFDLQEQKRWKLRINRAPGINGHEVYHPRWSRDSRLMAMTGPYKIGWGRNRIAAGGCEVEIYVGRFNADLTDVEHWWRITNNDKGDFYPDVWVAAEEAPAQNATKLRVNGRAQTPKEAKEAADKTVPQKTMERLLVEARLTEPSIIPDPRDIAPYRRALLVNGYEVIRVLSGSYSGEKIMAAHWVIEDGRVIEKAKREVGKIYRMALDRYDDHLELEGERLIMDSDEFKLTLYLEQSDSGMTQDMDDRKGIRIKTRKEDKPWMNSPPIRFKN